VSHFLAKTWLLERVIKHPFSGLFIFSALFILFFIKLTGAFILNNKKFAE